MNARTPHPFRWPGKGEVIVDNWGEDRATASLKDQGLEALVDSRGPREYLGDRALQMLMRFTVIFFDSRDDCARLFFFFFFFSSGLGDEDDFSSGGSCV